MSLGSHEGDTQMTDALRALNEAAYAAATEARKSGDKRATDLRRIDLETDALVEGRAQ